MDLQRQSKESRILLVEDDKEIREGIEIFLRGQGYRVFQAADGLEGLDILEREEIHLAIVDIMMPRMDGVTMVVKLREKYDIPVIFLSAKSEVVDKFMGLNMGADDYITKPFTPMELLARVNSQLRRYRRFLELLAQGNGGPARRYGELIRRSERMTPGAQGNREFAAETGRGSGTGSAFAGTEKEIFRLGGLELDEAAAELLVDGSPVRLTPTEFKIITLLMRSPGRVFSAEEIYERVWNERAVNTDTVMVHVRNIREKIEINPKKPKYLKVVWGVGYKMEKQP